jgi:hypothetical protein
MALVHGIKPIVTSGLVLCLDAANRKSYPGSGTTWTDLSGNGNNGTLSATSIGYNSANGGSLVFDGTDDYAPIGTSSFPFGASAGTISLWAKTDTITGGFRSLVAYGTPDIPKARFMGIENTTYFFGGYGSDITATGVPLNTWFNMSGVYTGTNALLYVNGALVAGPTAKTWNTVSSLATIGRQLESTAYWDGNLSQLCVYNRALTAAEIAQNYNALKGRYGLS